MGGPPQAVGCDLLGRPCGTVQSLENLVARAERDMSHSLLQLVTNRVFFIGMCGSGGSQFSPTSMVGT